MHFHLNDLEKVLVFKISLSSINDYDPQLKVALAIVRKFYVTVLRNSTTTVGADVCITELERLMEEIQVKLTKQTNYSLVMKQVNFTEY
jgi:hypothetical protein